MSAVGAVHVHVHVPGLFGSGQNFGLNSSASVMRSAIGTVFSESRTEEPSPGTESSGRRHLRSKYVCPTCPLRFPFRKKELLSRDDLQLPWRPLYDLYESVVYSKTEHLGLVWFPRYVLPPGAVCSPQGVWRGSQGPAELDPPLLQTGALVVFVVNGSLGLTCCPVAAPWNTS